jgi:SAM-dependent methyltransferase
MESLSFDDEQFDIFVTQDVFEHINDPQQGFKEISRVLKPGGAHLFTVPYYDQMVRTEPRIAVVNGAIEYLKPKEYHKNPVDECGSLVTYDYGRDLPLMIDGLGPMTTTVYLAKDRKLGLDGEFLYVFLSTKASH